MKAQAWSMDFVVSISIFLLVFSIVVFSWNYINIQNTDRTLFSEMQVSGLDISDILIRVPGNPENWNETNVLSIGLASSENVLNKTKVEQFVNMDYGITKNILGLPDMEYYFAVQHLNGTVMEYNGQNMSIGTYPVNSSIAVPIFRSVLFGETLAKMVFVLYV